MIFLFDIFVMDSVMIINFEKNLSEVYGLYCLLKCLMILVVVLSLFELIFYVIKLFIGMFFCCFYIFLRGF